MNKKKILSFRKVLRILERELGFQSGFETQCCGVTLGQCHILMELSEKNVTTIKDLSEAFGLDKSSVSRTVDKMVDSGLLERKENKTDRRCLSLSLTKEGQKTAGEINDMCNEYYEKLFDLIPKDKHSSILETLSLLSNAFYELRNKNGAPSNGYCCK